MVLNLTRGFSSAQRRALALKTKAKLKTFWLGAKPEGKFSHARIWLDAMTGMSTGFLASLVVASIIGLFGIYSEDNVFTDVRKVITMITPFAIGVGIGMRAKLNALRTISLAIVVFLAARSELIPRQLNGQILMASHIENGQIIAGSPVLGINLDLGYVGDVLSTIFTGAIMLYAFKVFEKIQTNWDFLLVPLLAMLIGIGLAFSVTYVITLVSVLIELVIYYTASQSTGLAIAVAPAIGAIMGAAITLPISSAALAVALKLEGDAAIAALAGTASQMICWGVMTHWSGRKWSSSLIIAFGSPMLHVTNYSRRPQLLILPIIISALTALIAVAIYSGKLPFPLNELTHAGRVTSGMGNVTLYGPIFTMQDNHAWNSVYAWTNAIFMQILMPLVMSIGGVYLVQRFLPRLMKKEWLLLWNDTAPIT